MMGQFSVSQLYLPFEDFLTKGFPQPGHFTFFIAKFLTKAIWILTSKKRLWIQRMNQKTKFVIPQMWRNCKFKLQQISYYYSMIQFRTFEHTMHSSGIVLDFSGRSRKYPKYFLHPDGTEELDLRTFFCEYSWRTMGFSFCSRETFVFSFLFLLKNDPKPNVSHLLIYMTFETV